MTKYGLRIESPRFVARLEITDDRVTMAAPILKYMYGWSAKRVHEYVIQAHWRVTEIGGPPL